MALGRDPAGAPRIRSRRSRVRRTTHGEGQMTDPKCPALPDLTQHDSTVIMAAMQVGIASGCERERSGYTPYRILLDRPSGDRALPLISGWEQQLTPPAAPGHDP